MTTTKLVLLYTLAVIAMVTGLTGVILIGLQLWQGVSLISIVIFLALSFLGGFATLTFSRKLSDHMEQR